MRVVISRESLGSNYDVCPYEGSVYSRREGEWRIDIESLDALINEVGPITVSKSRTEGIVYDIEILDGN